MRDGIRIHGAHHTKARACLNCGFSSDASTAVSSADIPVSEIRAAGPKVGDLAVCIQCGHLSIFSEEGFRELTDEEVVRVAGRPDILAAQRIVGLYRKRQAADGRG